MMKALKHDTVTLQWLKKHGACTDQVELFAKTFGDSSVAITPESIERASNVGLDINWVATRILTPPALKAYEEAKATAWKAYEEATGHGVEGLRGSQGHGVEGLRGSHSPGVGANHC